LTGLTEVGKIFMRGSTEIVNKISLEFGGHAPSIIVADSNFP